MSVVQLADMKAQLNVTFTDDDTLIQGKIDAAECWLFTLIGSSAAFPVGFPVQPPVIEAVKLLAAHFYENREASLVGVTSQELPLGVLDLINPYRSWAFLKWPIPANPNGCGSALRPSPRRCATRCSLL